MQVQRVVLIYNKYDWEVDGTPANTYGGQIQFEGSGGAMTLNMKPSMVMQILDLIAEDTVQQTKALASSITATSVRNPGLMLEHTNGG